MDYRGRSWRRAVARFAIGGLAGALLLVLGFAPSAFAAPVSHFAINSVGLTEGNAGTTNLTFTISYTGTSNTISVDWATANGTATAPADLTASAGTASFTVGGPMSRTITIPVVGDLLDEANETFTVNLTNPQPPATADITTATGTGTITDNDPTPVARHQRRLPHGGQRRDDERRLRGDALGAERADRHGELRHGELDGGPARRLHQRRPGRSRSPPARSSRPFRSRSSATLLDENDEAFFVNLSGQTNSTIADNRRGRHHRERRRATVDRDQRRVSDRGQLGVGEPDVHRDAVGGERQDGHGRVRHGRRHRDRAGRLHAASRAP